MGMWGEYVPVHERRLQAKKQMEKLQKKGKVIEPISIQGLTIAKQFWGKKWCGHIENFADYSNRLPRGRTYARNGSICHLGIVEGKIEAIVSGSDLYNVSVTIKTLAKEKWDAIKNRCSGMVGSILELLQGEISKNVMEVVVDAKEGLFPLQKEISYKCSCPDWAGMCKHVAAVLYGIGHRLDHRPELLFRLRGVDPQELVSIAVNLAHPETENLLQNDILGELFGIDLEENAPPQISQKPVEKVKPKAAKAKKSKLQFDVNAITSDSVKTLRAKVGLSISDFAYELGVTSASIYRWENTSGILKLQSAPKEALAKFAKKHI